MTDDHETTHARRPMTVTTTTGGSAGDDNVPAWAVRLEAKVDIALAQHGARLEEHAKKIGEIKTRVDRIEDRPVASPDSIIDHEHRIREIEQKPVVTPKTLTATLAAIGGVVVALTPFLDRLYS